MIIARIFEITFPIFAVVILGFVYGRRFRPDMTLPNRLNMDVFIPALLFSVLTDKAAETGFFNHFALGVTLVVLMSGLLAWGAARVFRLSPLTLCPPLMFKNAGNLGLPLMVLTFGEAAFATALIMFIVCSFFHITLGSYILDKRSNVFKVFLSPMILATITALLLSYLSIKVPDVLMQPIRMLGNICVPLMLFALGVRLINTDMSEWRIGLLVALLSPMTGVLLVFMLLPILDLNRTEQGVLFLFGVLPPAVMNFMFAEHYDQEPSRVAAMVLFGNVFSILSIPLALLYVLPKFG